VTTLRWTEQAVEDIRAIREFIERDSSRYGRLVAERLGCVADCLPIIPTVPGAHPRGVGGKAL